MLGSDDPQDLARIYAAFETSCRDTLQDFTAALDAGDGERLIALAHRLKSSARLVGANRLADHCAAIECAGGAAVAGPLADLGAAVVQESGAVLAWLGAWLAARSGDGGRG